MKNKDIIMPSQAKPSQAKPSQAKPSQAKPSQAKPSQAKPQIKGYPMRRRPKMTSSILSLVTSVTS
jgi:hypothetical protein